MGQKSSCLEMSFNDSTKHDFGIKKYAFGKIVNLVNHIFGQRLIRRIMIWPIFIALRLVPGKTCGYKV